MTVHLQKTSAPFGFCPAAAAFSPVTMTLSHICEGYLGVEEQLLNRHHRMAVGMLATPAKSLQLLLLQLNFVFRDRLSVSPPRKELLRSR